MESRALVRAVVMAAAVLLPGCLGAADPAGDEVDQAASETSALVELIQRKYGVRPRDYAFVFNAGSENEARFHAALPFATESLHHQLKSIGATFGVEMWEIAATFLTAPPEAAFDDGSSTAMLVPDYLAMLDENLDAVAPYLRGAVVEAIKDPKCLGKGTNADGADDDVPWCFSFETQLEAGAAVYAWSKSLAAQAMSQQGAALADLPEIAQFYWAIMFYRFGPTRGTELMQKRGVRSWEDKWTKADDPWKYLNDPGYNAIWRTATAELLRASVFDFPNPDRYFQSEPGCFWSTSEIDYSDDRSSVEFREKSLDQGSGSYRGYLSRQYDVDWYAIDVTEASYTDGMCIRATLSGAPDYRLCAAWDGPDDYDLCADEHGVLQINVDRAVQNDSGRLFLSVTGTEVLTVDECRSYQVDWSIDAVPCACIGANCPAAGN